MTTPPGTGTCDFCANLLGNEWWEYDAVPMIASSDRPGGPAFVSPDSWAACRTCRDLIQTGQRETLLQRILDHTLLNTPDGAKHAEAIRHMLRHTYSFLFDRPSATYPKHHRRNGP